MAPPFVLLERDTCIFPDEAVSGGLSIVWPWDGRDDPPTRQEMTDVTTEYLRTFKPRAVVADPPELSFLHIQRPKFVRLPGMLQGIDSGCISSADKNLVALYVGAYRPGSRYLAGGYLIYDARKDSFSVIPELPCDPSRHRALGYVSAVVMCEAAGDDYVLAELVRVWPPGCSEAALWLWKSSAPEWVLKPERISLPSTATHLFSVDLCFSYRGSILCWVDLLKGMVLCHLDQDCKLSFIPLPKDCPDYDVRTPKRRHISAEHFRSMACVHGEIKLVALDECVQDQPAKGLRLTVWTLSPDLSAWNMSSNYNVENIWADEAYPTGIPKLAPSLPFLSIHEDGVVYLILNRVKELDRRRVEYLGQSVLRVDMDNKKVQFYQQSISWSIQCQLFASEFSAHRRQCLHDHPREVEGSEFGASAKRMKP